MLSDDEHRKLLASLASMTVERDEAVAVLGGAVELLDDAEPYAWSRGQTSSANWAARALEFIRSTGVRALLDSRASAPAVRKLHEAMRGTPAVCRHPSRDSDGRCHTCGTFEPKVIPSYYESRGRPRSICELVDCRRQDTHNHEGKCEHQTPGDGSCANCRCAETPKGETP